jgi:hypothetical protein
VFWFSAEHPVLRPLSAVNVPLRIVVADGLLLRDIVMISSNAGAFRGMQVCTE